MDRYVLVEWPESQEFVGRPDCYFCQCNDENSFAALDQALFVPEKEYYKKVGLPYQFSITATNGELIDLLSQFPRDAVIGIEYCSPKNLQYFPDRNFIEID